MGVSPAFALCTWELVTCHFREHEADLSDPPSPLSAISRTRRCFFIPFMRNYPSAMRLLIRFRSIFTSRSIDSHRRYRLIPALNTHRNFPCKNLKLTALFTCRASTFCLQEYHTLLWGKCLGLKKTDLRFLVKTG